MKFNCKELSISDEEFGCTISFSENPENDSYIIGETGSNQLDDEGQYILLQRTYPEDEFENDYYYFESSEFEKSGELNDFSIELSRTVFLLTLENERHEINIDIDDLEFERLKNVLVIIANGNGILQFHS